MHVEGDGVVKLREYLMQTRRQAEMAIDSLNERIAELEKDNIEISDANKAQADERDYFRNLAEQRKTENSKKWRCRDQLTLLQNTAGAIPCLPTSNTKIEKVGPTMGQEDKGN